MQSKDEETSVLLFLLGTALILPAAAWTGYVAKMLWGWFAVPLGASPVGVWEAAGLILLARFLTYDYEPADDSKSPTTRVVSAILLSIGVPLIVLAFGFLYHVFAS